MTPSKDGQLWQDNNNTDTSVVRGDDKSFGDAGVATGMSPGAPVWTDAKSLDRDAVNREGGFGSEANSDPMFDRFKHEDEGEGGGFGDIDGNKETSSTNSADVVAGSALPFGGAKSDPEFERYPNAGSQEDVGSK